MTWFEINSRIFELEKVNESERDDEWKKEWDSLLDMTKTIPGILKREKYGVSEGEERTEKKRGKGKKGKNVANVS